MPWFLFNIFPQVWRHLVVFTILFCNVSPCIKKVMYHQTECITTVTCLVSDQYNQQSIIELLKGKLDTLPTAEINPCEYNLESIDTISTINWSLLNFRSMIGRKKTHTHTHTRTFDILKDRELYVTARDKANKIFCRNVIPFKEIEQGLCLIQEEVNLKMFLSASFIMYLTFESICIVTSDADICLRSYCSLKHAGKLYIEMLTNPNRLFNFSKIKLHKKL